jgi:hypothetical protein
MNAFLLYVKWEDGDSHEHYQAIAVVSSEEKARSFATRYSSTNQKRVAFGDSEALDPSSFCCSTKDAPLDPWTTPGSCGQPRPDFFCLQTPIDPEKEIDTW